MTSAHLLSDGQAHAPPSLAAWTGSACNAAQAWQGVSCEGGHLTALNLSGLNLQGEECTAYTAPSAGRRMSIPWVFFCTRSEHRPMIGAVLRVVLPVVGCSQRHVNLHCTKEPFSKDSLAAAGLQGRCHRHGLLLEGSSSSTCLRTIWQVCSPMHKCACLTFNLEELNDIAHIAI